MIIRFLSFFLFSFLVLAKPDPKLIESLQNDIKTNFIPKMQSALGHCDQENPNDCITQYSDSEFGDYFTLQTKDNNEVCLPYTECGFYYCMENKYHCEAEGVGYFTKLASPTCNKYIKNIDQNKFSKKGVEWIYSVMVCLQKGLISECEINGNCQKETSKKTCDYITKFTLEFHPGCYINSGVGVCKLPLNDKLNIWKTVGEFLTSQERIQAYKVVFSCINPFEK